MSKKKKGSNKRKQAKLKLAKLYIKIANQRKEYFHKLSNVLAQKYDVIFMEDLNIKAMPMMWGRKVSDLGFSELVDILGYKANVKKIDRFYLSSKTCSGCGTVNHEINKDLEQLKNRVFECISCGLVLDKDYNALLNIHRVGASTLSTENVRPAFVG